MHVLKKRIFFNRFVVLFFFFFGGRGVAAQIAFSSPGKSQTGVASSGKTQTGFCHDIAVSWLFLAIGAIFAFLFFRNAQRSN